MQKTVLRCPECGAENAVDTSSCAFCGAVLSEANQVTKVFKPYICPRCNKAFEGATKMATKKGAVCPLGHNLHEQQRQGFVSSLIAGAVLGGVVWALRYYSVRLSPSLNGTALTFLVIFVGFFIFKMVQGLIWIWKPEPTRGLAMHYFGLGLGSLLGLGVTSWAFYQMQ